MPGVLARLGRVLDWTCKGLAVVIFIGGMIGAAGEAKAIWGLYSTPTAFDVISEKGIAYEVIDEKGWSGQDRAEVVVKIWESNGNIPIIGYTVQKATGQNPNDKALILRSELLPIHADSKQTRVDRAWSAIQFILAVAGVAGVVLLLLGRAFRYILANE